MYLLICIVIFRHQFIIIMVTIKFNIYWGGNSYIWSGAYKNDQSVLTLGGNYSVSL